MAYNYEYPYYDSNMYNDDWLLSEMKRLINEWVIYNNNWDKWQQDTNAAFADLKNYVTNYFDNLDVQSEINNKLDAMIADGSLSKLIEPFITAYVQPDFVDSTNKMTDKNKTYILTTNGHVYYYDGSNFIDSGYTYSLPSGITINNGLIASYNYKTTLPDVNNVNTNSTYLLLFAKGSTEIPSNLPFSTWEDTDPVFLYTITNLTSLLGSTQYLITNTKIYYRAYSDSWKSWYLVYNKSDYKKPVECNESDNFVKIAYENIGSKIIVKGTHNLYEEFLEYKGSDYFDNYSIASGQGIPLQNGSEIIGNGNAVLVFNYNGDNNNVKHDFSPFFCDSGDSTIDGVEINATNCRYCIHDEHSTSTINYRSVIKNCRLILNNQNNSAWKSNATIGGGLGAHATIEIENNYLDGNPDSISGIVASYHNSVLSDALSYGIFSNNYIKKGTFRCGYYGNSTKMTYFLVSNNHLTNDPILIKEGSYDNVNMEIVKFNNEIE